MAKKVKMKTHRGASKRFSPTGSGKIKRKRAYLRHGMRKRSQDAKRVLRSKGLVSKADEGQVKLLLNM